MNRGFDKLPRDADRNAAESAVKNHPIASLDYAAPAQRESFCGKLALIMALVYLATIAYVRITAAEARHIQQLPQYWEDIYRFAWVPGIIGLSLAFVGLIRNDRDRSICIGAIIGIFIVSIGLLLPIMFS